MEKETNKLLDTSPKKERLVLVAVSERDDEEIQASLDELSLLVDTADGEEAGRLFQHLPHPNKATYVGSGKLDELREMVEGLGADGIVPDDVIFDNYSDVNFVKEDFWS